MKTANLHEASGATLAKPIAQPHVTTFREVFEDFAPFDVMAGRKDHKFQPRTITGQNIAGNLFEDTKRIFRGQPETRHADETMYVGAYCSRHNEKRSRHESYSVRCADWVLSRIQERTIIIGGDTMHFEIVDHDNGWSLVIAQHGQILGSVWLAYIKTDSIPKTEDKAQ